MSWRPTLARRKMFAKIIKLVCVLCLINAQFTDASTCDQYLRELSDVQSKFLQCVTKHSVPVTMCHGCKTQYDEVLHGYDVLASECNTTYFDKDRLNLVPSTETLLTSIWTKGYCDGMLKKSDIEWEI